jgi:hypothetical protein
MERFSQHSFHEIYPALQSICDSYHEDSKHIVELDKCQQGVAQFVAIKLSQAFLVFARTLSTE